MHSGAADSGYRRLLLLWVCVLAAALEGYDIQAFGVTAPAIAAEFDLNPQRQGWLASAAMLGLVVGAFGGGYLADRFGRRLVLAASIILFGVFSLATAAATSEPLLFCARFAAGVGFGGATPNLIAIASDLAPLRRRTLTVTMVFCGLPAGAALVSQLARAMGEAMHWRTIYIVGGIAPLLLIPLVLWLVPRGVALRTATSAGTWRSLFGAGRAGSTLLIWFVFATTLLLVHLMLNWLPSLIIAKGFDGATGATAAMAFNLASIAGAFVLATLVDRKGFRWPLTLTYGLLAAAIVLLAFSERLEWVIALSSAAGFLVVGPQCALYALVTSIYPPGTRVFGAGAAVGMGRFGSILGPVIAGNLRGAGFTADQVLMVIAPLALVAALATFILGTLVVSDDGVAV